MSAGELTLDGDNFILDGDATRERPARKTPAADHPASAAAAAGKKRAKAKGRSAAQKRLRAARLHRVLRLGIQVMFFVLAPGLFAAAFNGVKYLFTQIGALQAFEPTSFVFVLVALLAFTLVFGRFFCGYACAFGALGDWMYVVVHGVLSKTPLRGARIPEPAMKVLSLVKYAVAAAIGVACVIGVWADVSGYSPWVAFAGFTSGSLDGVRKGAFVLLGLCLVGMMLSERFFCRVLCPMGAVFALMPVLGFSSFTRTRSHCARTCGKCREACPVGLWPDADTLSHGECLACGRCVDACPLSNVNLVALPNSAGRAELDAALEKANAAASKQAQAALAATDAVRPTDEAVTRKRALQEILAKGTPVRKTRKTWHLLRGSSVVLTLAKAAALLALCWAVGVTRYLPSFNEVMAHIPWSF